MATADQPIPRTAGEYEKFETLEAAARKYLVALITRPVHLILIGLFVGPILGGCAFYAVRNIMSLKESRVSQANAISTNEKDIAAATSSIRKMAAITAQSTSGIVLRLNGVDDKLTVIDGRLNGIDGKDGKLSKIQAELGKLRQRQDTVEAVVGKK